MRYGDDKTIHSSTWFDVEVGPNGEVVAIWFRCHPIAFKTSYVDEDRAVEMRQMYQESDREYLKVRAIEDGLDS